MSNFGLTLIVDHDDHLVQVESWMSTWKLDDDRRVDFGENTWGTTGTTGVEDVTNYYWVPFTYKLQGA